MSVPNARPKSALRPGSGGAPSVPDSTVLRIAALPRNMRENSRRYLARPFASLQLLLVVGAGLLAFGVMMAASTTISAGREAQDTMWSGLIKETMFIGIGLPLFCLVARLPPARFRLLAYFALVLSLTTLVAVLIPGVGVLNYNARRWIDLGPLPFQPSEFAKLALLLWGADLLVRKQHCGTLTRARHIFIPLVPVFALFCGLIMLEPDLGTTLCVLMILVGLLWTVGLPLRYFFGLVAVLVGAVIYLAFSAAYRMDRVTAFLDPFKDKEGTGYHTVQGLYALASGGLYGVGLGNGTSKYSWVPNANTDFVFSIIGEELGLIGTLAVVALFGLLAYTGLRISRRSVDPFARLVAGAATIWLCGQALINIGYVSAMLPVTGIPLPFISAGGTSLVTTFVVFGMLASFARHEPEAIKAVERRQRAGRVGRIEALLRIKCPAHYRPPVRRRSVSPKPKAAPVRGRPAPARTAGKTAAPQRNAQQRSAQQRSAQRPPARVNQRRGSA